MTRHVVRLVAAALLAAAMGLGVPTAAQAATCSSARGVSVVVDFHQLGGGVQASCDAGGAGEYAAAQFEDAGHTLTYVQNEPFVCRVDGVPSTDPCVRTPPADAYWSLWWSDGTSGTWHFATTGVASLKVPAGGYVALSWQSGNAQTPPGVAPKAHPAGSPSPSPSHSPSPSGQPSTAPSTPSTAPPGTPTSAPTSAATSSSPTTSATPQGKTHPKRHRTKQAGGHHHPSDPPSPAGHADAAATTTPVAASGSGLPGWVAPGLVVLLFAATAAVVVVRRAGSGGE
ncbi:hypothetical protein [Nocardioides cynanchi]|uniref:hypothetical protein n=1 Tax=Nocardioides cynanchi TaxID=2558918 RepID=UPI001245FA7A|nr:hypothetical protein [Nocardioides cynanchi]